MYKKGAGNDKQGKDAENRTFCPYRNFSQAIKSKYSIHSCELSSILTGNHSPFRYFSVFKLILDDTFGVIFWVSDRHRYVCQVTEYPRWDSPKISDLSTTKFEKLNVVISH